MQHDHQHHTHHQAHGAQPVEQHNHSEHAGHSVAMFRDKFWLSFALTIPVLLYTDMIQHWFRFTVPYFTGAQYVPLILATVIFFYGGMVFIKSAVGELRAKRPGMMTLISLAIITAYTYSLAAQLLQLGEGFFWELATLVTIMLLGHWVEMASIAKARGALQAIAELLPDTAEKVVDGAPTTVALGELQVGDTVLVRPGGRVPVDGIVVDGGSSVDEAAFTGESKPVQKTIGSRVVAGTSNQEGALTVQVQHIGQQTALAGIMRLVGEAQQSKSNAQVLADKAAFALTITAIIVAAITFVVWFFVKDAGFALERMVTVLIIACPHALGLAIPLVVAISTSLSARNGLLVRRRLALEAARTIDVVLFDKTGTLTKGEHGVTAIWPAKGFTSSDILRIAASLEQKSEHIIGKGITKEANRQAVTVGAVRHFTALPGYGVKGVLSDKNEYVAANYSYIAEHSMVIPAVIHGPATQAASGGQTIVYIAKNSKVIGALGLADIVRPESAAAIALLKKHGIQTAMVTGDSREVAKHIAAQLGIDEYFAEVKPADKAAKVRTLQKSGRKVAMVGDGINDAPALAQAEIGIAIGAGTDIAIQSADIILTKSDPRDVVKTIILSKATYRKMQQNLVWATGYNIIAIPLAAGVLFEFGIVLAPAVGAVLMSASTVIVAANAQLLRRTKL